MTTTSTASPRLLVIDDSLTIRKLVELSFRGTSFSLDFATSGAEGAARAVERLPDVILLDCVLPDMKAAEVCQRLAGNEASARTPIILMSAKEQSAVRETFRDLGRVVDFVGKPFTTDEIVARVKAVFGGKVAGLPAAAAATPTVTPDQAAAKPARPAGGDGARFNYKLTEAAAKALYGRLAQPLASVPEWVRQAQAQAAGRAGAVTTFLARKLLTPEVVTGILEALLPLYKQTLAESDPLATPAGSEPAPFVGQVAGWPLLDLLAVVGASGKTGELVLTHDQHRVLTFWESGELVLCTSDDPAGYAHHAPVDLAGVPADARARAEAEQRASGTPLYVTLADAGQLPAGVDLPALLHERGLHLLRTAREAPSVRFAWRDLPALPSYTQTWGRHIWLTSELLGTRDGHDPQAHAEPPSIAQLNLERLRRPSAWSEVDPRLPQPDHVFERAYAFSSKLRALRLTASEQRVLSLVDRRHTVRTITSRVGLSAREVARILYRLGEIDVIQSVGSGPPSEVSVISVRTEPAPRPVMVVDADAEHFCAPLRELLGKRPRPVPVVEATTETDLLEAVLRDRPSLVVVSENAVGVALEEIGRTLRAAPQLAGTALAAVLDSATPEVLDQLAAVGFDAVWVKPIHSRDLIALISAEPAFGTGSPSRPDLQAYQQPSSVPPQPQPPSTPLPQAAAPSPPSFRPIANH